MRAELSARWLFVRLCVVDVTLKKKREISKENRGKTDEGVI